MFLVPCVADIYVWCRAMHVILEEAGIFSDTIYSVSILFAGVVCGPVAVGPAANFAVVAAIVLVALLWLPYQTHEQQLECRLERRSNMLLNPRYREALATLAADGGANAQPAGSFDSPQASASSQAAGAEAGVAKTAGAEHMQDAASAEFHRMSNLGVGGKTKLCAPCFQLLQVESIEVKVGDVLEPGQAVLQLKTLTQPPKPATSEPEPEHEPEPDADETAEGSEDGTTRHLAAVKVMRTAVGKLQAAEEDFSRRSLENRVRVIFHALDSGGDGYLTQNSIVSLLVTWGIPYVLRSICLATSAPKVDPFLLRG